VQVILATIVEFSVLACVLIFKPHSTRGGDILATYLSIVRLVCTGLLVAFVQELNVAPIPRVVIGIIAALIFSVAIVFMFFNVLFHLVESFRSRQFTQRIPSGHQSNTSVLETVKA
jgi:Transient receptor potential (TRP) ion channel